MFKWLSGSGQVRTNYFNGWFVVVVVGLGLGLDRNVWHNPTSKINSAVSCVYNCEKHASKKIFLNQNLN